MKGALIRSSTLGWIWVALTALAAPTLAAASDPAVAKLEAVAKALAKGCLEAEFTQTYLPAGFSTGRGEAGRLILGGGERLRFEYGVPSTRVFALDGPTLTLLDSGARTYSRRTLAPTELAHYPLFDLARGRLPAGFSLALASDGETIEIRPDVPSADLARAAARLVGGRLRRIEWQDLEGNTNRFELEPLARSGRCGENAFAPPAPAGYQIRDDRPSER